MHDPMQMPNCARVLTVATLLAALSACAVDDEGGLVGSPNTNDAADNADAVAEPDAGASVDEPPLVEADARAGDELRGGDEDAGLDLDRPDDLAGDSEDVAVADAAEPEQDAPVDDANDEQADSGGAIDVRPSAPRILSLSSNIRFMQPDGRLVVTAVVTDPDGIDDLIGGTLVDPDSEATYGAFATAAAEGAYSLTLTWEDIEDVRPVYADPGGSPRAFRAEFFDVVGNEVAEELLVDLACQNPDEAACGGECVDLMDDPSHCGTCHNQVWTGLCAGGRGVGVASTTDYVTCDEFCEERDWACRPFDWSGFGHCEDDLYGGCAAYDYVVGGLYELATGVACDELPPEEAELDGETYAFAAAFCFCAEPE